MNNFADAKRGTGQFDRAPGQGAKEYDAAKAAKEAGKK
jgi:hypothetical protein